MGPAVVAVYDDGLPFPDSVVPECGRDVLAACRLADVQAVPEAASFRLDDAGGTAGRIPFLRQFPVLQRGYFILL